MGGEGIGKGWWEGGSKKYMLLVQGRRENGCGWVVVGVPRLKVSAGCEVCGP